MSSEPDGARPDDTILLDGVSKAYRLGARSSLGGDLRDQVGRLLNGLFDKRGAASADGETGRVDALVDLSLRVGRGENVALVGPNGAGKTTLLQILSRITRPTEGVAWVRGRVVSVLQVGPGFHRELTGRENAYFYGAMLGLGRREVDARLGAIVAFAELERFMDTPVKHLSKGMRLRLGFSIATHADADVLLVDEVLSAADQTFRERSMARLDELAAGRATVLLVSHERSQLERLCERAIWLEAGRLERDGDMASVLDAYERSAART